MTDSEFQNIFGKFNDFPPQWREIDPNEFGRKLNHYPFVKSEYRQMHEEKYNGNPAIRATLFFFHDNTGVAVSNETDSLEYNYKWISKFYAFGCNHDYYEIEWNHEKYGPQFRGLHSLKCSKCGQVQWVDRAD